MKSISPPVAAPQAVTALVHGDEPGHKAPSLLAEQSHELDELPEGVLALLVQLQPMREPELKLSIAALESGQVPVLAYAGEGSLRSGKPSASKQGLTAVIDPLELPVAGSIPSNWVTSQTVTVASAQVLLPVAIAALARTPQVPGVMPDTVDNSVKTPTPVMTLMSTRAPAVDTVLMPKNVPVVTTPVPAVVTTPTQASVPAMAMAPVQVAVPAVATAPTQAVVPAAAMTPVQVAVPAVATAPTQAAVPMAAMAPVQIAVSTIATAAMPTPAPAVAAALTQIPAPMAAAASIPAIAKGSMSTQAPVIAAAPVPFLSRLDTEQLTADTDNRVPLASENQPPLSVPVLADRSGRGVTSSPLPTPAYTHSEPQPKAESTFTKGAQSYLQVPFNRGDNSGTITISKAGVEQAQPLLLSPSSTEIAAHLSDSLAHIQEPRWRLADQQGHEGRDSQASTQEEDADEEPRQGFHGKHKEGRSEA